MASIVSDLCVIKMFWEGRTYTLKAEKVKWSDKQTIDTTYASDSHDPAQVHFGQCEYSIDLTGCQSHRTLFSWIRERQRRGYFTGQPNLSIYRYDNGKLVQDSYFKGVYIEEISKENQDPFDVKLVAMARVYRNNQNNLI
jgi:hypothetical protein